MQAKLLEEREDEHVEYESEKADDEAARTRTNPETLQLLQAMLKILVYFLAVRFFPLISLFPNLLCGVRILPICRYKQHRVHVLWDVFDKQHLRNIFRQFWAL